MRIAINQPYFLPYAGYFRLLSQVDMFVVYDDAQFEKGGWVHRNQLVRNDGNKDWCGIPISRPSLGTKINEMEWQGGSDELWIKNSRRFRAYENYAPNYLRFYTYYIQSANRRMEYKLRTPLDFITGSLEAACYDLDIGVGVPRRAPMLMSSSIKGIPDYIRGEDRVIWMCKELGAKEYINAPGGRHLYNPETFRKHNIDLKFLCDYPNKDSIIDRLASEKPQDIRKEINDYASFY